MNPLGIFFREAGTTLIELLVGTALFLVIFAAGVQFLGIQNRWTVSQERTGEAQRQAWMALDMMQREISLAGSGLSEDEAVFLVAEESEVAFLSNIDREVTVLTASAARGDTQIQVAGSTFRQGTDFEDGNEVRLCNEGVCEQHRLAGEAGSYSLEFREPVRGAFPPGSTVDVVHRIHYRLKKNDSGGFKLIRIVDGGGGPLAENISEMRLRYLDRSGRQVSGPEGIRAVGITIHVQVPGRPAAGRHLEGLAAVRNGR